MLKVTDDSGFLAVVVPAAYHVFVHRDWQLDQLFHHFRQQMSQRSLLIWSTGSEATGGRTSGFGHPLSKAFAKCPGHSR